METEPRSKIEIKDALSDINRIIGELTQDLARARAEGDEALGRRLLELKLRYMEQRGKMTQQLSTLRRRRYDE